MAKVCMQLQGKIDQPFHSFSSFFLFSIDNPSPSQDLVDMYSFFQPFDLNCLQAMPQDIEQPDERTKLLPHPVTDRRLSAVQHEGDQQSIIGSYVSKDEQALSSAPIGERLPYNDYTTIDWLHDLVRFPAYKFTRRDPLTVARSKIHTAFDPFTLDLAFDISCSLP